MFAFSRLKKDYCSEMITEFLCGKAIRLTRDITDVVVTNHVVSVKPSFVSPSLMEVSSE